MSQFAKKMAFYTSYHQESTNVWIHVFGVPTITFTAFIALSWLPLFNIGVLPVTAATALYAYSVWYYLRTDLAFGLLATGFYGLLLFAAHQVASLGVTEGLALVVSGQIVAWSAEIFGHTHFEGNRPAFLENLHQAFISAPLFILADLSFHFGLRKDLQADIHKELSRLGKLREQDGNFLKVHQA